MKTKGLVLDPEASRDIEPGIVTLYDRSRFQNNGAMTDVTWVRLPSGLWVMGFNGTTSIVNCGVGASLANLTPMTLIEWINPTTTGEGNSGRLFDKLQLVFNLGFAVQQPHSLLHRRIELLEGLL